MMSNGIRVLVVDDHPLVQTGLRSLIDGQDDLHVVDAVGTGELAVQAAAELAPDVILMDLQLPGIDGIRATQLIRDQGCAAAIVVLTSFADEERIISAFDAGADGYLLKDSEPDEILSGIRAASAGHSPIAPKAARALVSDRWRGAEGGGQVAAPAPEPAEPTARLTGREVDVLRLVRSGHANKQIARRLEISEATVKAHLTSIFQRIGVRDRTQAAIWAHEHGV
jgi:DNA-binding NarL/FixJ family response regulator